MKSKIIFAFLIGVAVAVAEPPRYRPARFRFQRIELVPTTTTESPTEPTTDSAPYPASGWKPAQPFSLPNEQTGPSDAYGPPEPQKTAPSDAYGPPEPQKTAPSDAYGPPEPQKTAPLDAYGPPEPQKDAPYPASGWKPDQPFTLPQEQSPPATKYGVPDNAYGAPSMEATTTDNPQAEKVDGPVEVQKSTGEYYVLLPNGLLQKVTFATQNDVQNMKYTTSLQLRNPAPLFVFGP